MSPLVPAGSRLSSARAGKEHGHGGSHRRAGRTGGARRCPGYREGEPGVLRAGAARVQAGRPPAGSPHLRHRHPGAAGAAGLADLPGRDPGGDGGHLGVLEAAVLPARRRHRVLGGQRPRRQERPRQAQDGQDRFHLVVQARRARHAAAQLHPRPAAAAAAGPDPLPPHSYSRAQPGEAARRETAGRRAGEALQRDL